MARIVTKDPDLDSSYTLNWAAQLDSGVTISTSSWTIHADLTEVTSSNTTSTTSITVSGGTDGTTYELTNDVTLSAGGPLDAQLYLNCRHDIITEPRALPVDLADVKEHLRVTNSDDDRMIEGLLKSAIEYVENKAAIDLIDRTRTIKLPRFEEWELDRFPVRSVARIRYWDNDNARQTLNPTIYNVFTRNDGSALVELAINQSWPSIATRSDAVELLLVSGYGVTPDNVPENAKLAIKMLCRHWYDDPAGTGVMATQSIDSLIASCHSGFYAHC